MENTAFNKSEGQPHPNGTDILRSKRRLFIILSQVIMHSIRWWQVIWNIKTEGGWAYMDAGML